MPRRTAGVIKLDAASALISAFDGLGLEATVASVDVPECDFVVEVMGRRFEVIVKSVITSSHGEQLAGGLRHRRFPLLVVADRIAADAKRYFCKAGVNYFDRRGELRVTDFPMVINTVVEPQSPTVRASGALSSQVAKEVAITCLLAPDQPHDVREVARYINRVPSAVSKAMAGLRYDGLLTSAGEAITPDLFHELLAVWRRRSVLLAGMPDRAGRSAGGLADGLDKLEDTIGWALTNTLAAVSWGMPIIARGDHPPDFYVPTESELRSARSMLGEAADPAERACTIAVSPVRLACLRRVDHSKTTGEQWPVANHIVVALDIAQDRARGLEALDQWQPEGIVRAW